MSKENSAYFVEIVPRRFVMTDDDYHATITRLEDGEQLIITSWYLWYLKWRTRKRALRRAFRRHDRREARLAKTRGFTR